MDKVYKTGKGIVIPSQHITLLDRKPFIKFPGLVRLGHETAAQEKGHLTQTYFNFLQIPDKENNNTAIIVVRMAIMKDGVMLSEFTGTGDASPMSVNSMVRPHIIRMAETRAIARSLRILTDVGMTAFEELDHLHSGIPTEQEQNKTTYTETKLPEKTQKDDERVKIEDKLKEIKNKKGFSNKAMISSINVILGKTITKLNEVTNEEITAVIKELSKNDKKIESPEHTEKPKDQTTTPKPTGSSRADLINDMRTLCKDRNIPPSEIKVIAIDKFKLKKDFASKDLTEDQLTILLKNLKKKYPVE